MKKLTLVSGVLIATVLLTAMPSQSADGPGHTSHDGLELVKKTRSMALYTRPGASLAQDDRVAVLECPVAFSKDWQRDQNEDRGLMGQVTKKDMDRIKSELSKEFLKIFTRELQDKGGYKVVTVSAKDVLVLRPAIMNLDISAPDDMTPGMSQTFAASAGSMTLYLESYMTRSPARFWPASWMPRVTAKLWSRWRTA